MLARMYAATIYGSVRNAILKNIHSPTCRVLTRDHPVITMSLIVYPAGSGSGSLGGPVRAEWRNTFDHLSSEPSTAQCGRFSQEPAPPFHSQIHQSDIKHKTSLVKRCCV
jgi:hypothetical protein